MRMIAVALVLAMGGASVLGQTAPAAAVAEKPTVTRQAGAYQVAWLTLDDGPQVFLALRDGKPVQFWSTAMQLPGGPKLQGNPKLLTDGLRGQTKDGKIAAEIDLRLVSIWTPMARLGEMTLVLDLTIDGNTVAGTFTSKAVEKAVSGKVSGTLLDEAASRQANGIAAGQDWPGFFGAVAAARGPDYGKPMVEDLAQAKPLWRSEAVNLSGWGTGVDSRYKTRAAYGALCGGSSSPVVAEGKVYLFHYRPSGDTMPEGADAEVLAQFKGHAVEYDSMKRYFSKRVDVVVTCMDAATGQTVWESVWPGKQGNIQTHKWRGNNPTPAVGKGVVVVADYAWSLYAHDAKTGELKWTRGTSGNIAKDRGPVGPVISGETVVWTTGKETLGLDVNTGAERWKAAGGNSARRMVVDGKERVLVVGDPLVLVDPADGKELSRMAFPGGFDNKGRREIGRGAGANLVCEGPYVVSFETVKAGEKTVGNVFALKVEGDKLVPAWTNAIGGAMEDGHVGFTIANGHVYTAFQDVGAFAIELATGKTAKRLPELNAHSNPIYGAVDDRLFWQPECQHGRQMIQLMDAKTFVPLGANWKPPHNDTTAYGEMPTANVVVDGRLIIRGMDGVYCYDLRK